MSFTNPILIGVLDLQEAKRLQAAIDEQFGVRLSIRSNPDTCSTGGCRPTVELLTTEADLPKVREFLAAEKARALDGLNPNFEQHDQVYDPEKSTATCPACGTTFSTLNKECPDCGLVFQVE
jgi:hypothetical protein